MTDLAEAAGVGRPRRLEQAADGCQLQPARVTAGHGAVEQQLVGLVVRLRLRTLPLPLVAAGREEV